MVRIMWLLAALLGLGACGSLPDIAQSVDVVRAPEDALPLPSAVGEDGRYAYTLGPFDKISIEIFGLPKWRREVTLSGQGVLSYPPIGALVAAGYTPSQLEVELEQRLRSSYVRDPRVSVNVEEMLSHVVTVSGQVNQPGLFPVRSGMTLIKAVALAGGETEVANLGAVVVFRESGGRQFAGLYNLKAIQFGNYVDPQIYPGDKIIVSRSETRRLLSGLQGVTNLITTPLILLLQ